MPDDIERRPAEDAERAAHPPFADRLDDREHPAQPEQTDEGFGEGQEDAVRTPDEEHIGTFDEGQEELPRTEDEEDIGRFSEGQELEPETPEKVIERRFSEGQEEAPDSQ
jgi:hypothetical protein